MSQQPGLPLAQGARWEEELEQLYQKRDLVSNMIDSLERYQLLAERAQECRTGDSGLIRKPCQPSYAELETMGGLIPSSMPSGGSELRNRRAG